MDNLVNDRLQEIESQLAFQEDTIQSLNNTVAEQQLVIDKLTAQLVQIIEQMKQISEAMPQLEGDEPPPPHY